MAEPSQAQAAPQHVLITGATSGIGAELARAYAAPGVRLALFGRDEGRARSLAEECRAKGALVACILVDVTDEEFATAKAQVLTMFGPTSGEER